MLLQPPDQLSITLMWIAAIFMAAKAGIESWPAALQRFPQVTDWGWLSFVPLFLLAAAAVSTLRAAPSLPPASQNAGEAAPVMDDPKMGEPAESPSRKKTDILPERISKEYIDLMMTRPTHIEQRNFLKQYEGKWIKLRASILTADVHKKTISIQFNVKREDKESESFFVHFDPSWENHLKLSRGEVVDIIAKISLDGYQSFIDAEPL